MFGNGKNRYTCDTCSKHVITEDRDEGTTPFTIRCKATLACNGIMVSSCYRGVANDEVPSFIWRKPTPSEISRATKPMLEHFAMGGLDIFPSGSTKS